MNDGTIYKGVLKEFTSRLESGKIIDIMYRIINFGDLYFFAEEISTGCIFPVYFISHYNGNNSFNCNSFGMVNHTSLLLIGKYYAFWPLKIKKNQIFKYSLDKLTLERNGISSPTVEEVNQYLRKKKKDSMWRLELEKKESSNVYACDLNLIKEKITMLKDDIESFEVDLDLIKPKYENYFPSIDLKAIEKSGYDLSTQSELCNLIGREDEIKRIIKTVAIKGKSVILLGEPGAGKTSIAEKLALDIRNGDCEFLEGKVLFYLSSASLVAGTRYRGEFEQKLMDVIEFCKKIRGELFFL